MDVELLHCPVCHSEELSPETGYSSFEHAARFPGLGGEGLLGQKDLKVSAARARVCLDCGHLMLFVGDAERKRLRAALG